MYSTVPAPTIHTQNQEVQAVVDLAKHFAKHDISVLCLGETGTGKELIARHIHAHSERSKGPFVPVNCAAIPTDLIESELFGHVKGAFTGADENKPGRFELADGGTIFLDEIGDMPADLQPRLLRALDGNGFNRVGSDRILTPNFRVVAATNQDLGHRILKGLFREDLFYRLHQTEIRIPPLRKRSGDIPHLASIFAQESGKTIAQEVFDWLDSLRWPGNVRQLSSTIKKLVVFCDDEVISMQSIEDATAEMGNALKTAIEAENRIGQRSLTLSLADVLSGASSAKTFLEQAETGLIMAILEEVSGDQSRAAALLRLAPDTIAKKLER